VAAVTVLVTRAIPWAKLIAVTPPRTRRFQLALFVLFTMHFARTVSEEARRMMIARRISVPRTFGPGAFCSLQWAVAGVFRRSLTRAERFYGAQVMKGLGD
jgi:hypothetical protein